MGDGRVGWLVESCCLTVPLEDPYVLLSVCYLVLRRALQLAGLRFRSAEFKELEIVVLREGFQNAGSLSRRSTQG